MQQYSYQEILSASERFAWRVEDLIGGDHRLDFSKPFLPDPLARTRGLDFLAPEERRVANQIRVKLMNTRVSRIIVMRYQTDLLSLKGLIFCQSL